MEETFAKLQAQGKNDVDGLIKWMKDAKLIEATQEAEAKARALFADVVNERNVEINKFKQIVAQLAKEQQKSVEELSQKLSQQGPKFMEALDAGIAAFTKSWREAFK